MPHVDNDHVSFHIVFIVCYINPPHECDKDAVDWPLVSFYTSWTLRQWTCGAELPQQQGRRLANTWWRLSTTVTGDMINEEHVLHT